MPDVARWKGTTLRRSARSPRLARLAIRLWLADGYPAALSNALLVVSELVTNAVLHVPAGAQRDWVKVRLGFGDDFVRLEVIDPGTPKPELRFHLNRNSMAQSGRGLGLVASLSVRCGTQRLECGHRVVWADVAAAEIPAAEIPVIGSESDAPSGSSRPATRSKAPRPVAAGVAISGSGPGQSPVWQASPSRAYRKGTPFMTGNQDKGKVNDHERINDLYEFELDESLFAEVDGTTVAYARIAEIEDAFAVRDMSNLDAGTLRLPGAALRKLGVAI
ncbi:ATP-binding protein [Nonomuraea sp. 10N515B]|uniref:ATP-binding protein n=1 Tax=Nonomuraea sp. 10N515B TaxID=3457422 RepID=UPI003FCCCC00